MVQWNDQGIIRTSGVRPLLCPRLWLRTLWDAAVSAGDEQVEFVRHDPICAIADRPWSGGAVPVRGFEPVAPQPARDGESSQAQTLEQIEAGDQ